MSLLDIFNTDAGRQALGLMAAGGPVTDPNQTGFGQRMQSAVGSFDAWKQKKVENAKSELQLKLMTEDLALKTLAEKRASGMFEMQQDAYKSIGSAFGGGGIGQSLQTGQPLPNTPAQTIPGGIQLNQLEKMAIAGVPGAKEMFDIYKYKNDPMKLEQGATYENRVTGRREFMPKIGEGVGPDGAGNYGALPGYAGALASIEGAKAGAVESAKARLDPFTMTPQGGGNPILTNRFQAVNQPQSGGIPPHLLAQVMADAQKRGIQPSGIGYNGVEQMAQPGNMAAGFGQREGVALQSEAEKVAAVDAAKADEARRQGNKDKATQFKDFRGQLDYAKKLLEAGPTGGNFGAMVDSGLGAFSIPTTSGKLAKQLETTSAWMIQNIPKAPGAQSDAELRDYKTAAGLVGDKTVPVENRLGAITTVNKLIDLWDDRMNNVPAKATSMQAPKQAAINDLKMNPNLRDFFDQKYGEGAAARVLGK